MTDFMKALPVIHVQPTCPRKQRAKGIQFLLTCNQRRESHKTQVWLCFLVLSFLSTFTCAASMPETEIVQICLEELKSDIQNSDAMLYAPSANDVKKNCKKMSLKCYMLELMMVIEEEDSRNDHLPCISGFINAKLPKEHIVGCPPCEAYPLKNITVFLERLDDLLEEMTEQEKIHNHNM